MLPLSGTLMNKKKVLEANGDKDFLDDFYKSSKTTLSMQKKIDHIDYEYLENIIKDLEGKNIV
jgi:hypothetical protein